MDTDLHNLSYSGYDCLFARFESLNSTKTRSGAERDHMAGEDKSQLAREKNEVDIKDEFVSNCTFSFKLSHCHIV